MQYNNIMVDIETLSTKPHAAIISIGAVLFDAQTISEKTFYMNISAASNEEWGRDISQSTQNWWAKQSAEAKAHLQTPAPKNIGLALIKFSRFIAKHTDPKTVKLWGNGSDFDNVILATACRTVGIEAPWKFYNNRCYRTVKNLAPSIKIERTGTHHNALHDAQSQAQHLQQVMAHLGLSEQLQC